MPFSNWPQLSEDGMHHCHMRFPAEAIHNMKELAKEVGVTDFCQLVELAFGALFEAHDLSDEPWLREHREEYNNED